MAQTPGRPRHGSIWRHPLRLPRYFRLRLARLKAPPEVIARGAAIGVFVALLPIVPFHTVSALGLAFLTRSSKAAALIGTLVSNPFDMVPHYMFIYYLGHRLLPLKISPFSPAHIDIRVVLHEGWELLAVLMAGGLAVAIPSALAAYGLSLGAVRGYRRARERRAGKGRTGK